jgi:hypothetical protein
VNFVRDLVSKPKSDLMPRKTFSENNNREKSSLRGQGDLNGVEAQPSFNRRIR